jgi:hypothetical protein
LRVDTENSTPEYSQVELSTDVSGALPIENGGTGAATAEAARTNLEAPRMKPLVDGTNFNTVTETGFFSLESTSNSPASDIGPWQITNSFPSGTNYGTQIAANMSNGRIFLRNMLSSSWSSWTELVGRPMKTVSYGSSVQETGIYSGGSPGDSGFIFLTMKHFSKNFAVQLRFDEDQNNWFYLRKYVNGSWTTWKSFGNS